ncbi:MAG: nucleotide exchange factor GrpE [Patescibacteria group bacterium]
MTKKTKEVKKPAKQDYKKLSEEYLAGWKRERSDFENYKKQEAERSIMIRNFDNRKMLLNVLEIVDNFELALLYAPKNIQENNWFKGIENIKASMDKFLENENIVKIKTFQEKFNPEFHEAIEGTGDIISKEMRAGYIYKGKLLRPARVKLS